jgi:hypothetical protein
MKGGAVRHNFERDPPKDHIPAKFSVIWFSGFRGEDLNDSRWLLLLKIEISSNVHCCFIINQNELKF